MLPTTTQPSEVIERIKPAINDHSSQADEVQEILNQDDDKIKLNISSVPQQPKPIFTLDKDQHHEAAEQDYQNAVSAQLPAENSHQSNSSNNETTGKSLKHYQQSK